MGGEKRIVYPKPDQLIRCSCGQYALYQGVSKTLENGWVHGQSACFDVPEIGLSRAQLDEIDRNARAYGWEIGNGHPLVEKLDTLSPNNPFLSPDWAEGLKERHSHEGDG